MSIIDIEKTFFFSSAAANGARNIHASGSAFEVTLDTPVIVPPGALNCSIECRSANIWFIMPNISKVFKNNRLYFRYDPSIIGGDINLNNVVFGDANGGVAPIVAVVPSTGWDYLELPDGLYSVNDLNTSLKRLIGYKRIPGTLTRFSTNSITISANPSTQHIVIEMDPGFILGTMQFENNICHTLGITKLDNDSTGVQYTHDNDYWEADSTAGLTPINSFLLHSDLIENGLRVNNGVANILTEIQLSGPPGSFLTYRPYLPYRLDGNHLKFSNRDTVKFYLTDHQNRTLDMFGEAYSFSIVVRYSVDVSAAMNTGYTQTFRRS